MKKTVAAGIAVLAAALAGECLADAAIGEAAPGFTLKDIKGKEHKLSDYKGKPVVLEWTNYDCPFVRKHYGSGNMQKLQATWTGKDVVWFTVCSSAKGKSGNYTAEAWQQKVQAQKAVPTAVLLDEDGTVGRAYGAKTTPHLFVVDAQGKLAYRGGIDDHHSAKVEGLAEATNYVTAALDALLAGKPVETTEAKPYGCGVKY